MVSEVEESIEDLNKQIKRTEEIIVERKKILDALLDEITQLKLKIEETDKLLKSPGVDVGKLQVAESFMRKVNSSLKSLEGKMSQAKVDFDRAVERKKILNEELKQIVEANGSQ
ncbi:MAG: hypothetical protein KDD56_04715 [Bdellovibrionales bacterium]|nr:hypothetical protein [Bdellovibrionales bacterium]